MNHIDFTHPVGGLPTPSTRSTRSGPAARRHGRRWQPRRSRLFGRTSTATSSERWSRTRASWTRPSTRSSTW
ncbi:hypothetical protein ACU686_14185 [Yinghuangia aomiensis]